MKYLNSFANLILVVFLVSCFKNEKADEFKKLLKEPNELKKFSIEDAMKFFELHNPELENIKSVFLDQNTIRKLIRKDIEKSLLSKKANQYYHNLIEYDITCFNGNVFFVSFDSQEDTDENKFWNNNYEMIIDKNNNNLKEFLLSNKIDEPMFKNLINFIRKNKIFSIRKSEMSSFIKINFEIVEGLIYFAPNALIWESIESTTTLEKITDNWYYFKEVY